MIAIATHSDALTTMPATLAARWPGRWRTCASASDATGEPHAGLHGGPPGAVQRESSARHSGATASTEARSHEAIAA
jgi:hypothetical protein